VARPNFKLVLAEGHTATDVISVEHLSGAVDPPDCCDLGTNLNLVFSCY
jgi:hypothetical protein